MNKYNTIQDFFQIEVENEDLRDQLLEVQSSFTAQDQRYLELNQERFYAETEYGDYRQQAQSEIQNLAEDIKDKELELARLRDNLQRGKHGISHVSGFSIGDDEQDRLKN